MQISYQFIDLPERIQNTLSQLNNVQASFKFALKTTLKPNATLPILWMVITENQIIFCNTHATRGIYKIFNRADINSFKIMPAKSIVDIIFAQHDADNFTFTTDRKLNHEELISEIKCIGYEVI